MKFQIFLNVHLLLKSTKVFSGQILNLAIIIFNVALEKKIIKHEQCLYYSKELLRDEKFFNWALNDFLFILGYAKRLNKIRFEKIGLKHKAFENIEFIYDLVGKDSFPSIPNEKFIVYLPETFRKIYQIKAHLTKDDFEKYLESLDLSERINYQKIYLKHLISNTP